MRGGPRSALWSVGAAALAACAAAPRPAVVMEPPRPAEAVLDPSFDWHVLLPAAPGTRLVDMPVKLHEVLLFHGAAGADPADASVDPEHADCHGLDGPAPRFAARAADDYLVCFVHDRLSHVAASVRLAPTGPDAARLFTRICTAWLARSTQAAPALPADAVCEGRDDGIEWRARLGVDPADATQAVLAVTLTAPSPGSPPPDAGPP